MAERIVAKMNDVDRSMAAIDDRRKQLQNEISDLQQQAATLTAQLNESLSDDDEPNWQEGLGELEGMSFEEFNEIHESPVGTLTEETAVGVQKRINSTRAGGMTDLADGILDGIAQQTGDDEEGFIRVVFVFTDGAPTVGEIRDDQIIAKVKKAVDEANGDVRVYTFGYGDVRFDLLKEIANIGNGVFYLIANEQDVPKTFGAALAGNLTLFSLFLKLSDV